MGLLFGAVDASVPPVHWSWRLACALPSRATVNRSAPVVAPSLLLACCDDSDAIHYFLCQRSTVRRCHWSTELDLAEKTRIFRQLRQWHLRVAAEPLGARLDVAEEMRAWDEFRG